VWDKLFSRLSFFVALAFTSFMCSYRFSLSAIERQSQYSMFLDHLDLFRSDEYSKFESGVFFDLWPPSPAWFSSFLVIF
jgi:hypothetical protein